MPKIELTPPGFEVLKGAEMFSHGYLPLAAAYCRKLGLVELVNRMVPSEMQLQPGIAVQAMVLDTLSGRTPLYRLEQSMADRDVELLLGENVPRHLFNDNNLGRCLDAVFEAGSSNILTEVGVRATRLFALDASVVSYDTTSTSVWGDYAMCQADEPPPGPKVTYGHSKDHRPDLKQFMTELLCVERGVPIAGATLDGNSSDKTSNNKMLTRISSIMARCGLGPGAFTYVADSAMVTRKNLEEIGKTRFVSRLPATFEACGKAIGQAVSAQQWVPLGRLAERPGSRKRPGACYKAFETTVTLHGTSYRAVVIHSDSHDKRRQKKLVKELKQSEMQLCAQIKKLTTVYHCEADATQAVEKTEKLSTPFHRVTASFRCVKVPLRGRPPKDKPRPTRVQYELELVVVEKNKAVQQRKTEAGCFVLLTTVPIEGKESMDAKKLLQVYKGQYGVESDFAFLKDPLVVNDLFLKMPHRIDALGMVLVLALMVWRLMERSLRAWVNNTGEKLPGWNNQQTDRPTSFMVSTAMYGIQVLRTKDGLRHYIREPGQRPREYLQALGLDESVFIDCRHECRPIIPVKQASNG